MESKVKQRYPDAEIKKWTCPVISNNCYYTVWYFKNYLAGMGDTEEKAWEDAWNTIKTREELK